MKRILLAVLLSTACTVDPGPPPPIYVYKGDCLKPTQLSNFSGTERTFGVVVGPKIVQRCQWQWYGGLANGEYHLVRVDTIAPSGQIVYYK